MIDKWTKMTGIVPQRDWGYLTCGGVLELDTKEFEEELRRAECSGPKLGEAGTDEDEW